MRTLRAVEFTASLSVRHSGASVARQVVERSLTLPDLSIWGSLWGLINLLIVWSYLFELAYRLYDFVFVGWPEDLRLIWQAVTYGLLPTQAN